MEARVRLTGSMARPYAAVERLLATGRPLQAALGLGEDVAAPLRETKARERIHWPVLKATEPPAEGYDRPFVLLGPGNLYRTELVSTTNWLRSGSLWVHVEQDVDPVLRDRDTDATAAFLNFMSELLDDFEDRGRRFLAIQEMQQDQAPARVTSRRRRTRGDWHRCALEILWGI